MIEVRVLADGSLYVVGLADRECYDAERQAAVPGETNEVPNADHRLEVAGDVLATLDAWRSMADSIVQFTART